MKLKEQEHFQPNHKKVSSDDVVAELEKYVQEDIDYFRERNKQQPRWKFKNNEEARNWYIRKYTGIINRYFEFNEIIDKEELKQ